MGNAIIIGAGIAGLYQLYRLREFGLSVRVYETGSGVGGQALKDKWADGPRTEEKCDEVAAKGYEGFLLQ